MRKAGFWSLTTRPVLATLRGNWKLAIDANIHYLHESIDRDIGDELGPKRLRVPAILGDFVEA